MKLPYQLIAITLCAAISISAAQETQKEVMEEWNYAYEVHQIALDSQITIAYIEEGHGEETLLFVHGLGSNLQAWNKNIEGLKDSFRCVALDLPGYGKSSHGEYAFTPRFFAEQIHQFCMALELSHVILVGHSMGGQIAMHLSLKHPDYLQKTVLIAPAGFEQFTDQEHAFFKTFVTPDIIRNTSPEQIRKNFEINFYEFTPDAEFMIKDRMAMRDSPYYDHFVEMIPKCVAGMLHEPVYDRLGALQLPVLVLYGLEDKLIPNRYLHPNSTTQSVAEKAVAQIPEAQLILLDRAGHFVQWDRTQAVNQAIIEFVHID